MHLCPAPKRTFFSPRLGLVIAICSLSVAAVGQEGAALFTARASSKEKSKLREGAKLVDKEGRFSERAGGRHYFTPDGETDSFTVLENQTLERVVSASSSQDDGQKWIVTAQVTEFKEAKFLLLERAVIRPTRSGRAKSE